MDGHRFFVIEHACSVDILDLVHIHYEILKSFYTFLTEVQTKKQRE
jgi:hypothetical protein